MLSARLDLGHFHPAHVVIDADYVRNMAWNYTDIAAKVRNNPLPVAAVAGCTVVAGVTTCPAERTYAGGNEG
ncbi:MAG: hypothetical protein DI543_28615, partial [Bradyrhizobium icense]